MPEVCQYIPRVVQAIPGKDYTVYAYFDDGTIHLYDVEPLIRDGTVFAPLRDKDVFRSTLTVLNDTVAFEMMS